MDPGGSGGMVDSGGMVAGMVAGIVGPGGRVAVGGIAGDDL